jgi:hypothetical protein
MGYRFAINETSRLQIALVIILIFFKLSYHTGMIVRLMGFSEEIEVITTVGPQKTQP